MLSRSHLDCRPNLYFYEGSHGEETTGLQLRMGESVEDMPRNSHSVNGGGKVTLLEERWKRDWRLSLQKCWNATASRDWPQVILFPIPSYIFLYLSLSHTNIPLPLFLRPFFSTLLPFCSLGRTKQMEENVGFLASFSAKNKTTTKKQKQKQQKPKPNQKNAHNGLFTEQGCGDQQN